VPGGSRLACGCDHSFDIARHGYVNLTAGRAGPGTADTSAMVAARDRFLGHDHYQPLAVAVQSLATRHDPGVPGLVADLAGGTGYYLAGILDALPHRYGACIDLSVRRCGAPPGRTPGRRPSARTSGSPCRSRAARRPWC
jgi:23S rRNA (guanine745-N1)-methyltransferase